jgi:hypothetical protein
MNNGVRALVTSTLVNSPEFARRLPNSGYWPAVFILLPLVLQRLFLGGLTGSYSTYEGVALAGVGYVVHLGFVLAYAVWGVTGRVRTSLLAAVALVIITLPQVFVTANMFEVSIDSLMFPYLRALVWVFAVSVYATVYFESEAFVSAFINTMSVAGTFIVLCYLTYVTLGIPIGVNIEDINPRVHGTFSEPSTLACVFPAFIVVSYMQKRYWACILGLLVVYLAASAIVTGALLFVLFAFVIQRFRFLSACLLYVSVGLAVLLTLSLDVEVVTLLEQWSSSITAVLDLTIGDSAFRAVTIDRILQTITMLADYSVASTILDLEDSSGLARYLGTVTMVQNMRSDGTTWFGYGLSIYGNVATKLYGTALDFGLFPYLLGSFGVAIGTLLTFAMGRSVMAWHSQNRFLYFIFLGALAGTLYNSGGGILAYTLPLLAVLGHSGKFAHYGQSAL